MKLFFILILFSVSVFAQVPNLAQVPQVREKILAEAGEIPLYFTALDHSILKVSPEVAERSILFIHPKTANHEKKAGLRLFPLSRKNLQPQIKDVLEVGDIVLSFRAEWAGGGAYPSVQLGTSHAGMVYKDASGNLNNIDMPLNDEYVGSFSTKHYLETPLLHVIRPRLNAEEKRVINEWLKIFVANRKTLYPAKIVFNADYAAPRYDESSATPFQFIKDLASHALQISAPQVSVFCSEFAYAILALRNCDPVKNKADFTKRGMPNCVKTYFEPLPVLGNELYSSSKTSQIGLADGAPLLLRELNLSDSEYTAEIDEMFTESTTSRMSVGHRQVAQFMKPKFDPLKKYFMDTRFNLNEALEAHPYINLSMKPNYSPTAYMINVLLPSQHQKRVFDYQGTLVFID